MAGIWGCSFLFIKVGLDGLSPPQVVLGRVGAGALVLLAVLAVRRQPLPRGRSIWLHSTVFAVIGNVVPFLLFAWGETHVSSSRAGVLNATTPLCTLLVAMLFLPEEGPTRARVTGLLIGFAGVVVLVGPWSSSGGDSLAGQLACLAAAASYGVAFTYTRRFLSGAGYPPAVLAAVQLTAGTVILLVMAPFVATAPVHLSVRVVLSVLTLGALGTGFAYLIYHGLVRDTGATFTSMVTYLAPVVAVVLGVVALDEPVVWNLFVGALIIILGVAVAEGRLHLHPSVLWRIPPTYRAKTSKERSGWRAAGDDVQSHVVELGVLEAGDDTADEGGALGLG